jgi:hypothetical protein
VSNNSPKDDAVDGEVISDTDGTPGTEVEPYVDEHGEVMIHGAAAAKLAVLLASVPVDQENGSQRIAEQLLTGTSIVDLNAPWDSTGGREMAGKQLRIDAVKARPSQFPGGLRAFLVAEGFDLQTGERAVITTSAMAPVIQLARCAYEGWLPAYCVVEVADRPTERGFYPYHLRFTPPPAAARS